MSNWAGQFSSKTPAEREIDQLDKDIADLRAKIFLREGVILSSHALKDWDLREMQTQKAAFMADKKALEKLIRLKEKKESRYK